MNHRTLLLCASAPLLLAMCREERGKYDVTDHRTSKPVGVVPEGGATPGQAEPSSSKFQPGQVWAFKSLPKLPDARLTILRVDDGGKVGRIIHVALSGVEYGNGQTTVSHLPFQEDAIQQSVTKLERESGPVPDYEEGYKLWREAYEAGKGGIFTTPVAETFEMITGVVREQK